MLIVTGRLLGCDTTHKSFPANDSRGAVEFDETILHVLDGVAVSRLSLGKNFDTNTLPQDGADVVVRCTVKGSGGRVYYTAHEMLAAVKLEPVHAK